VHLHDVDLPKGLAGTTVDEVKAIVCQREAVPARDAVLIYEGRRLAEDQTLAACGVAPGGRLTLGLYQIKARSPFFPLADCSQEGEALTKLPTPDIRLGPSRRRFLRDVETILVKSKEEGNLSLHLWRMDKAMKWVELVIDGPVDSFYEGGEFLLRIAAPDGYPFQPFAMRLLTPIYHPTVGPAGNVAVLGLDIANGWSPGLSPHLVLTNFFSGKLRNYEISQSQKQELISQIKDLEGFLNEWECAGEEQARERARLWVWHYATGKGRAYWREGGCCRNINHLASLMSVDAQLRAEAWTLLLIALRTRPGSSSDTTICECQLGHLPQEVLQMIILEHLAIKRSPPLSSEHWELANGGDDGLPENWRDQVSIPTVNFPKWPENQF